MGFALPAALGAKLVYPDRTVVAVCGDGGFAMSMNGLMTAIEEDIPIVVVVFNNAALGWVLHGGTGFAAKFNDFDFASIARAIGCHAERVSDPGALGPAIKAAIASRKPAVIDVVTSLNDITFADITSPLAKMAAKVKR
jgi:acetolactate synthase-1/2/3 large subunit